MLFWALLFACLNLSAAEWNCSVPILLSSAGGQYPASPDADTVYGANKRCIINFAVPKGQYMTFTYLENNIDYQHDGFVLTGKYITYENFGSDGPGSLWFPGEDIVILVLDSNSNSTGSLRFSWSYQSVPTRQATISDIVPMQQGTVLEIHDVNTTTFSANDTFFFCGASSDFTQPLSMCFVYQGVDTTGRLLGPLEAYNMLCQKFGDSVTVVCVEKPPKDAGVVFAQSVVNVGNAWNFDFFLTTGLDEAQAAGPDDFGVTTIYNYPPKQDEYIVEIQLGKTGKVQVFEGSVTADPSMMLFSYENGTAHNSVPQQFPGVMKSVAVYGDADLEYGEENTMTTSLADGRTGFFCSKNYNILTADQDNYQTFTKQGSQFNFTVSAPSAYTGVYNCTVYNNNQATSCANGGSFSGTKMSMHYTSAAASKGIYVTYSLSDWNAPAEYDQNEPDIARSRPESTKSKIIEKKRPLLPNGKAKLQQRRTSKVDDKRKKKTPTREMRVLAAGNGEYDAVAGWNCSLPFILPNIDGTFPQQGESSTYGQDNFCVVELTVPNGQFLNISFAGFVSPDQQDYLMVQGRYSSFEYLSVPSLVPYVICPGPDIILITLRSDIESTGQLSISWAYNNVPQTSAIRHELKDFEQGIAIETEDIQTVTFFGSTKYMICVDTTGDRTQLSAGFLYEGDGSNGTMLGTVASLLDDCFSFSAPTTIVFVDTVPGCVVFSQAVANIGFIGFYVFSIARSPNQYAEYGQQIDEFSAFTTYCRNPNEMITSMDCTKKNDGKVQLFMGSVIALPDRPFWTYSFLAPAPMPQRYNGRVKTVLTSGENIFEMIDVDAGTPTPVYIGKTGFFTSKNYFINTADQNNTELFTSNSSASQFTVTIPTKYDGTITVQVTRQDGSNYTLDFTSSRRVSGTGVTMTIIYSVATATPGVVLSYSVDPAGATVAPISTSTATTPVAITSTSTKQPSTTTITTQKPISTKLTTPTATSTVPAVATTTQSAQTTTQTGASESPQTTPVLSTSTPTATSTVPAVATTTQSAQTTTKTGNYGNLPVVLLSALATLFLLK